MGMNKRTKETCFRCRALYIGMEDAICLLGFPIIRTYRPSTVGFYGPDRVQCPKPLTWNELDAAQSAKKREAENDIQTLLL